MRVERGISFFFVILLSMILVGLSNKCVAAASEVSIEIIPDSEEMDLQVGEFGEESQTIIASTTSSAGYTIGIQTSGPSSALINTEDEDYTIPTFTLPSEAESIPVSQIGDGYGYSLDDGEDYLPVPEPGLSPATLFKTTHAGENTHELTFGAKVPMDAVAGEYTNSFKITIVANLEPCGAGKICYYGNGDDGTGKMDDQAVQSNTDVDLIPSNYSRPNYGFAGWNTSMDGMGTNYGPGETINVGDLSVEGLQLYAKWIPSAGTLQGWDDCDKMQINEITALDDERDGNTYAVAKYANGQCWMMENLRLDLSAPDLLLDKTNTNRPTNDFINAVAQHPASSNKICESNAATCINSIQYNTNNINRNLTASYTTNDNSSSWYSYGVNYNWYTATAGNGTYSISARGAPVGGDLCPTGWTLPSGYGIDGDLAKLDIALGGDGQNKPSDPNASKRWRKYPTNTIYSGEYRGAAGYNRGISAGVNTKNTYSNTNSTNLWVRQAGASMNGNSTTKNKAQTLRCVARTDPSIIGNIHYDANGGTGTMPDELDIDFNSASAANNAFTKANEEFVSWNTKADGTGIPVAEGAAVATAASEAGVEEGETLTLYAIWKKIYSVSYDGNSATAGSMDVTHDRVDLNVVLVAPNFVKSGFGFAGWSPDSDAAAKLAAGTNAVIYGPNQRVQIDSTLVSYADENNHITLYATWLPEDSTLTMQTFGAGECANLGYGELIALADSRNGEVYTVTKLKDNHCWMTENLKLDPSAVAFDNSNTNAPTADFITKAASSSSSRTLCGNDNDACIDTVQYNLDNIDLTLTPSYNKLIAGYSWYSYGGMYSWYAASAGNGTYDMASGSASGDICPNGWRLPTGGNNGEFKALNTAIGGSLTNDDALKSFPNNFIYSGDFNKTLPGGRGTYGRYWSSTAASNNNAFRLGLTASTVTPVNSYNKWDAFAVRCIVK